MHCKKVDSISIEVGVEEMSENKSTIPWLYGKNLFQKVLFRRFLSTFSRIRC